MAPGTSIIFVRHPFERLLSAFRDKLEDPSVKGRRPNDYYYNKHGRKIVMHYRRKKVRGPNWKYPRFAEFVDYVLGKDVRLDDEHWSPYYRDCTPCHINFTFIGQYLFLDTWEWPEDENASFTFDRVEDPALLCSCHQATLRLSTGTFTCWQTKLASLNGTTRM